MPFSCIFQLNNGAIIADDEIIFVDYIDEAFGKYHDKLVEIARVLANGHNAAISTTCPCFASSKGKLKKGEHITDSTHIAYFAANGEDIPYDRPYAKIVYRQE